MIQVKYSPLQKTKKQKNKKTKNKNQNQNPYNVGLPYIYCNTIPKTQLNIFKLTKTIDILFDQEILLNKKFKHVVKRK